jgi:hypothetical protein
MFSEISEILYQLVSTPLKLSFLFILIPSMFVLVSAVLSAKSLGGELGTGLKKIAAGTVCYVILYLTVLAKEVFQYETMPVDQLRVFFIVVNIVASSMLVLGFVQIYRVSKRLRLF